MSKGVKNSEDYIVQLSKCLPSSRLYEDHLNFINSEGSDEELEFKIKKQTRLIGDYTAAELSKWKKVYKETGKLTGPKGFMVFQKKLVTFYNEKDE